MKQSFDFVQGNDIENRKSESDGLVKENRKLTEFLQTWSKGTEITR
jgi:hypothetical protein